MRPLHRIAFLAGMLWIAMPTLLPSQVIEVTAETNWANVTAENVKLAEAADEAGNVDEASEHYRAAFVASVKAEQTPLEQSRILRDHGFMLRTVDRNDEARILYTWALRTLRSDPDLSLEAADTAVFLADLDFEEGEPTDGEALYGEAIAIYSEELGRTASETIAKELELAAAFSRVEQAERANLILVNVERACSDDFGVAEGLALCLDQIVAEAGSWVEGDELLAWHRKALAAHEAVTRPDSPERVDAVLAAGSSLYYADFDSDAIELFRQALQSLERRRDPAREADARTRLAEALAYVERSAEAVEQFEIAIELQESLGADADTRIALLQNGANALFGTDRNEQAFEWLEASVAIARAEYGDPSHGLTDALNHIGDHYQEEGWHDDARRILAERLTQLAASGESDSLAVADIQERLGDMARSEAEPAQAVVHYERMVQIRGAVWGEESTELIPSLGTLAETYILAERPADANAVNMRVTRIGMIVIRDQLSVLSQGFKLLGLPGWAVLLAGFVGVGAIVVAGGVVLTRRLARVDAAATAAATPSFRIVGYGPRSPHQGSFEGQGGELFGIWIVNMLLTVLTAGIYHFWAKVRLRRYIWAHSGLGDDRFAFHGTPKELFWGWLKGAPLLAFILYGPTIAQLFGVSIFTAQMIALAAFGLALLLWPIAEVGAHRYRLTRSSWRGIRFAFDGSPWRYLGIYLLNWPLWLFTLGLWTPFFNAYKRRFLIAHMSFGNSAFQCEARGRDLFWRYVVNWILFIPTLGMYGFWYRAYRERYYWSRTTFRGARFRCTVTGSQLLEIYGVGTVLIIISLGLAWPWVHARRLKVWLESIHVDGNLDLESVRQRAQDDGAVGEGFADFLGLDTGFLS